MAKNMVKMVGLSVVVYRFDKSELLCFSCTPSGCKIKKNIFCILSSFSNI